MSSFLPPTSQYTASLPFQAVFSAVFLLALLTYRVARILSSILISNLYLALHNDSYSVNRMAQWGLIGKFAALCVLIISSCIKVIAAFVQTIFFVFYSFIPFIVLGFAFMIVQQRWGDSAMMVTSVLNDPESPVSQTIHYLIRVPLQVLDEVAFYVVPVYNLVIFIFVHIPLEFFAKFLFGDGGTLIMGGITSFSRGISLMVQAIGTYVQNNHIECPSISPSCWNYTTDPQCIPPNQIAVAAACLDVSKRQFDALPFLAEMMKGVSSLLKALAIGCNSMETLVNIVFFPLTDPSLWKTLHYLLNSVLYIIVGAPTATTARCSLGGGFYARPSLCTPDFGPVFDYAALGMEALGDAVDNFLDMLYLLVFYGNNAECPSGQMTEHSLFLPIWKDPLATSLFGPNTTALVTLSSTLFALTDGYHSVYVSHTKSKVDRRYFPSAWGSSMGVNPRFGVASVLNKAGDRAMLGCRCIDTPSEMVIQCSTSSISSLTTATTLSFNSSWETVETPTFMQCSTVRVLVQSVRWPESRITQRAPGAFTATNEDPVGLNDPLSQTKLVVDAVVYVIPTCGGNSNTLSCFDNTFFTLGSCFPFCMALHNRNTGSRPLLFRGFESWKNGVMMVDRDCVPIASLSAAAANGQQGNPTSLGSSFCSADSSSSDAALSDAASALLLQSDGGVQCNYNPVCTSWISNKSDLISASADSYDPQNSIPAFADTERYVRHVLEGQPLVAAGGVIMRVSEKKETFARGQRYVDFPLLVGNQRNEFTVEVASPAGIPVDPPAATQSLSVASETKGFIPLPPNYIEMVDIYNPATLSMNVLWYAVNPSYDWMSCFAKYCATEGLDVCVQLMVISSYTPIRLWKVRYRDSACFVRTEDGTHVCREDVAVGFALDPQMDLPKLTSSDINSKIGGLCSGDEYNLWVESMEYFDELNIAVTVRRGSVKALYYLMQNVLRGKQSNFSMPKTDEWAGSNSLGYTVVYFVHTRNTSLVRALEPWTSLSGEDVGFLSVVHGNAVLCPELRFLPSLGLFLEHSFKSVIYAIKMPVNLFCNLFALLEMLAARAVHACPSDGLGHSVLQDCGMALFSLDPFFNSLQQANKAFWDIVAWVASLIRTSLPLADGEKSIALNYFESFVAGVAVYGEASQMISLFQVSDLAENLFDTGIQDSVLGGRRRRILSSEKEEAPFKNQTKKQSPFHHNNTSQDSTRGVRKLLGYKTEMAIRAAKAAGQGGKIAGKGLFNGILSTFSGGLSSLLSVSRSLVDASTMSMSSADFSILLSSMNPTDALGSAVMAPGIVWAQFTYETILPMTLDLASTLLYSQRFPQSTAIIWVRLNDAKDNYDRLIEPRLEQCCSGLRLMLGYKGGLPSAVYHNCISATKMQSSLFSLTLLLFTEIPFYSCLCVQSGGRPFPDYILSNCMEWIPASRKGMWQSIVMDSGKDATKVCQWYGDYLKNTAMHIFDDWALESHRAATSLASFMQDLITPFAKDTGSCTTFQSNINTFVMLPIPSEHYHVCGKTSECKLRCADTFAMFEYELKRSELSNKVSKNFPVSVESPFFNPYQSASGTLYYINDRILGLSSRNLTSSYACSTCSAGCLVVAATKWDVIASITVSTYCTPPVSDLKATIFAAGTGKWEFTAPLVDEGKEFSMTYCNFALQPEELYILTAYTSAVMTVASSGLFSFSSDLPSKSATAITRHKLYATRHIPSTASGVTSLILDTDFMTSTLLSMAVQDYVFEGVPVYNAYVTECRVNDLLEVASGVRGKLVFFMSIVFSAQGLVKEDSMPDSGTATDLNQQLLRTGYITAILSWCDPDVAAQCPIPNQRLDYSLPCKCEEEGQIFCQTLRERPGCRPHVDAALYLAQRGTFLHAGGTTYLFMPALDARDAKDKKLQVQYVKISPDGLSTEYPIDPPSGLTYPISASQRMISLSTSKTNSLSKDQSATQIQGTWSHSDVFALSGLTMRNMRSPFILNASSAPIRWLQAVQPTSTAVEWLREMRIEYSNRNGFELVSTASQKLDATAKVGMKCSPSSCTSCASTTVRLLCHALQDCMLSRCIGTTVNYKNILCSIGVVVQQLYMQMVTSWRAVYLFVVEVGMFALNGFGGSLSQKIVLSFPSDLFYGLVCACKDVFASMIAMIMSVVDNVYGLFTLGRIDLTLNTYLTPQEAVHVVQTRALGGLLFNVVADATLYPLLAMHRWILCITNTTMGNIDAMTITVQFGDMMMDGTWGVCSTLDSKKSFGVDGNDFENIVQDDVDGFVQFSMNLLSGIGETVLHGANLMYDSFIAFMEAIVWNIQNIIQAYNLRSCKVSDYTQRIVLQCACGDTPFYINDSQRGGKWMDGALWCSGSLAVNLVDGTQGIIYNPYSLNELSDALSGVTNYIQCLATATSQTECKKSDGGTKLSVLTNQGVEPIVVWTKCKTNYIEQAWDTASGVLFTESASLFASASTTSGFNDAAIKQQARAWAQSIAPEFLQCMQNPDRLFHDFSTCLKMYLNLTSGRLPNAYFVYARHLASKSSEPPDACSVFSGLNASAEADTPLQKSMHHCIMDQDSDPTQCPFNPTIWSAARPGKVPIAKMFGTLEMEKGPQHQPSIDKLKKAFDAFNKTFLDSADKMQVALFSADGDFIHDFIDCVFLGPYTRVDMLPCDEEGMLECPFYARDENGGVDRNFTACFGPAMHGDGELPFTCGSQTRRALIKYFFRNYTSISNGKELNSSLVRLIQGRLDQLMLNLTNVSSLGCLDPATGRCHPEACTKQNEYAPCLDMDFTLSAVDISKFVLKELLAKMDSFFAFAMQDTAPWTTFYNVSKRAGEQPFPAQWASKRDSALKAKDYGLFRPTEPVLAYDPSEVYSMPLHTAEAGERLEGSLWSLCMALISQGQMSLPMSRFADGWRPLGADDAFLGSLDWGDLDGVASAVRNLTRKAADKSPFIWHKARYHAPSHSGMCRPRQRRGRNGVVSNRIRIGRVEMQTGLNEQKIQIPFPDNLSLPFHGFTWGMLGNAHEICLCGYEDPSDANQCKFSSEACAQLAGMNSSTAQTTACVRQMRTICASPSHGVYRKQLLPEIWNCLHHHLPNLRCPELGPSDSWGIFPVDCDRDGVECATAGQWLGDAQQDVTYEGIRLAMEGRGGLKLPNLQHVLSTYHEAIDYTQQPRPATSYQIGKCFAMDELSKEKKDDTLAAALQDWVRGLFPAAQLHHDSSVVAYCSRFVVEVARAEALSFVSAEASIQALQDARLWKKRCHAKVKHLTSCARLGVYYDVPPPEQWRGLATKHCDVVLDEEESWSGTESHYYLTPWCIAVNRPNRTMYDARLCLRNAMMSTEDKRSAARGNSVQLKLKVADLTPECSLSVRPLDLLPTLTPVSSLFTSGAQRMSGDVEGIELASTMDRVFVQMSASGLNNNDQELVSQVLDWWPASSFPMPVGFHITAPMIAAEIAPVTFDSHYAYDASLNSLHYVHTALRNHSLLLHTFGAGGVCRAHSVGMPIFETNTNRVCTRMRKGALDSPQLPVDTPKFESDIPPMGPYAPSVLENFDAEVCAPSYTDVPWPTESERDSFDLAGSIPRLHDYLKLDEFGTAVFPDSTFPPPLSAKLLPVKGMYKDWGKCAGVVKWDDSPTCYENRLSSSMCPRNTMCLSKRNATVSSEEGVCFSTAAFRRNKARSPCFSSKHCADGLVCLADGGCSPLYLHMWNTGAKSIDFALMADDCGFHNSRHPFTQSMRGVSPWEQIPDLLHAHGMCSHRNWFAYRNAIKDDVCPPAGDVLTCNATEAIWPDVQMRFDGCQISSSVMLRFSMAQQNVLQIHPHPCDRDYMHAALAKQRLKVCSGYQGIEKGTTSGNYISYALHLGTWEGVDVKMHASAPASAHWMRTYDEATGALHVGNLLQGEKSDTRLGFLGAVLNASEPLLADMAEDAVKFFRCTERMACQMPEYTYGGAIMEQRISPGPPHQNYSESSLRRCGAIGSLLSAERSICRLDIELFPLFAYILTAEETNYNVMDAASKRPLSVTKGCFAIWPKAKYISNDQNVFLMDFDLASWSTQVSANLLQTKPSTLFCSNLLCLYLARASTVLSEENARDHVADITEYINSFLHHTTARVADLAERTTDTNMMLAYESINLCSAALQTYTQQLQANLQVQYNSTITSGFYVAFRLSLYEFPQQWFHHCMLSILLAKLHSDIPMPETSRLTVPFPLPLPLWSSLGHLTYCATDVVRQRKGLFYLLCHDRHPLYVFSALYSNLIEDIRGLVREEILSIVRSQLLEDQSKANVQCFTEIQWNCDMTNPNDGCWARLRDYYRIYPSCPPNAVLPDVCEEKGLNPLYYHYANERPFSLTDLSTHGDNLVNFLTASITSIEQNANNQFRDSDYISSSWVDVEGESESILAAQVNGIDTSKFTSFFNTTEWMHDMCQESIGVLNQEDETLRSSCTGAPLQTSIAMENSCLFPENYQYADADRFFFNDTSPVVTIRLTNEEEYTVDVCASIASVLRGSSYNIYHFGGEGPWIKSVYAPPGVIITAYTDKTENDEDKHQIWTDASVSNTIPNSAINCAWKSYEEGDDLHDRKSWWPVAFGSEIIPKSDSIESLGGGFDGYRVDFDGMNDWHKDDSNWKSYGCSPPADSDPQNIIPIYALTITLETLAHTGGVASAHCAASTSSYPMTSAKFKVSNRKPDCGVQRRAFRVADDRNRYSIWRCAACTRFEPVLASNGAFACTLASGAPLGNLFTTEMIQRLFPFLYSSNDLLLLLRSKLKQSDAVLDSIRITEDGGILKIMIALSPSALWNQLENWGGVGNCPSSTMWECPAFNGGHGYDATATIQKEKILWAKAVTNPTILFTMDCQGQKYSTTLQKGCNTKTNAHLSMLASFVEKQYRQTNGIWVQSVSSGQGVGWRANVAHSAVGKFTLFYTEGDRPEREVLSSWILGKGPCEATNSILEDRVCMESTKRSSGFEAMHPWIGGDFNPFMGGNGLDECPFVKSGACAEVGRVLSFSSSRAAASSNIGMCPCKCSPKWACEGKNYNYSQQFMDSEFPDDEVCTLQKYSNVKVMDPSDGSNLCSIAQQTVPSSRACLYSHGILGGSSSAGDSPVSSLDLHGHEGVDQKEQALPQEMMDYELSASDLQQEGVLWSGQKLPSISKAIPFLRMRRELLHPAHIAFGLDTSVVSLPLVIKAISLLPLEEEGGAFPPTMTASASWVQDLRRQWNNELGRGIEGNPEIKGIFSMYPQLDPSSTGSGDWSCPIRKFAFLAGDDNSFGPLTPNPVAMHAIYGMRGVHPLIKTQGPYPNIAPYYTTNGACFYREDPTSWPQISIDDIENQCGLRGMLHLLVSQAESLTSVQESFDTRCNDILDVPDVGGALRSGETLAPIPDLKPSCGVLHRVTPALISTKGNRGSVRTKGLLSTLSPGGDCHMGRALSITDTQKRFLLGKRCFPVLSHDVNAMEVRCPENNLTFYRVKPVPLEVLINKKSRVYRRDLSSTPTSQTRMIFPIFKGPAGMDAFEGDEEISFGMLYSASLKEMLVSDLMHQCASVPGCTMAQQEPNENDDASFMRNYVNGSLLHVRDNPFMASQERAALRQDPLLGTTTIVAAQTKAWNTENDLWNASHEWAWQFLNRSAPPIGNVDKSRWLQNRTEACNASFYDLLKKTDPDLLKDSVRRLSLCAPPPTGDLGTLCTAMTQYKVEVAQKNCQGAANGDCISNMRMLYLPYMWSPTNQDYAFNTVRDYYDGILSIFFPGQTDGYSTFCRNANASQLINTLGALSRQQNALCPASGLEVFKDMLASLKKAGPELLRMVYMYVMMVANIIASVFTTLKGDNGSMYLVQAGEYMLQLFVAVGKLLLALLDVVVELFSTISPAGKVLRDILVFLCEVYNWIMKEIIIEVWCGVIRAVVIGVLKAVQALAFMNSNVVNGIEDILKVIGDGTAQSCKTFYNTRALANCPSKKNIVANINAFEPQPMATLCWANNGGGGIYTGVAQSLLSCTSSDTCAREPLLFDDMSKEGLIYCGSCPSVQTNALSAFRFGCDTYLQRCVCGTVDDSKTECTKNSDCSGTQSAMCGVAAKMEDIRSSRVSTSCAMCRGMERMEPVCILDGQGSYGVCGCSSISLSNFMTCAPDKIGTRAMLPISSTQSCAVLLDTIKSATLMNTIKDLRTVALDFGEIALTSCSLNAQNLCMDVSLPLSSSIGLIETPMVVLLQLLRVVTPEFSRRRLLSEPDILAHKHAPHDDSSLPLFNEWVEDINSTSCQQRGGGRDEVKKCLYWAAMSRYTASHFNLSESLRFDQERGALGALWELKGETPGLFTFLLDLDPMTRRLHSGTKILYDLTKETQWGKTALSVVSNISNFQAGDARRHLFSFPITPEEAIDRGDWSFNCTSLQKPMQKVVDAFWLTIQFYMKPPRNHSGSSSQAVANVTAGNSSSTSNNCSINAGLYSCVSYTLPPSNLPAPQNSITQQMADVALYAPTLGFGGERLLDALLSPMDYEEAVKGDFVTGRRILHDMGSCNHTQVTMGGGKERNFFVMFTFMVAVFHLISSMCMPLSCCQWGLWIIIFPMFFFWAMYNTSPLCWPMIPTSFVHDMYLEVTYFLPQQLKVPKFLVKPHCTLQGTLQDGSYDPSCFASCSDAPFLFVSWQDSLMWWVCEISTEYCVQVGEYAKSFGPLFKDMTSSSDYFASVINYSSNDPEFVQAHRLCAFFSFYQVIFLMLSIVISCYLLPTLMVALIEIFMGCVVLLMDTYIADTG